MWKFLSDFLSKLDWSHPSTYVGLLGALGAPVVVWKTAKYAMANLLYPLWLRIFQRQVIRDFYYIYREATYRIVDETNYLYVRKEIVRSGIRKLSEIPIQFRWTCDGEFHEEIIPAKYELIEPQRELGQISNRRRVSFDKPIRWWKKATYTIKITCTRTDGQPEPFLSSWTPRRVDELLLRVIFPLDRMPKRVYYCMVDLDGKEQYREQIDIFDLATGEFRRKIPRATGMVHQIRWEN